MAVVTVGTTAGMFVSGPYSESYLLRNSGDVDIYLGASTSININQYDIMLTPGSSMNWASGVALYAFVTDTAKPGQLTYLLGANTSFSPGPAVIDTRTTYNVTLLETVNVTSNDPFLQGEVDVSSFASILITIRTPYTQALQPLTLTNYLSFLGFMANLTVLDAQWLIPGNPGVAVSYAQIPVKDSDFEYRIQSYGVNEVGADILTIVSIYGSNEIISQTKYVQGNPGIPAMGNLPLGVPYTSTIHFAESVTQWIASANTSGVLSIYNLSAVSQGGKLLIAMADSSNAYNIYAVSIPVNAPQYTVMSIPVVLPLRPIRYFFTNFSGASDFITSSLALSPI